MKSFKVSLVLVGVFLSFNVFAAGECANDQTFKKECGNVQTTGEAIDCVNMKGLSGVCGNKIQELGEACSPSEIKECEKDVSANNGFEVCLSKSSNPACSNFGKKYQ